MLGHFPIRVWSFEEFMRRFAIRYICLVCVAFCYSGCNPNGSQRAIAGILNKKRNVLGMMPHPERAVDAKLGGTDGLILFDTLAKNLM